MKRTLGVLGVVGVLSAFGAGGPAGAIEPPDVTAGQLVGKTLSAVAFMPRRPGMPGGGALSRIMLQAYLAPGGHALVRLWDAARDSYTPPAALSWSLAGSVLCIDLPLKGATQICTDIHIWGPRIGGVNATPYAMLDGDLQPGNAIGAGR
ncbi:MAG: hypothetical protein JO258_02230 [Alphaproteobacteria bacterium]|nr:hypothetical protein [Alphaproteobacteria bacterium]